MFPAGDIDWFKFNLAAGIIYDMSLYSTTDITMTLFNSSGSQLAVDNNPSTGYSKILWTCDSAGTYYIKVNEVNSAVIGNYSLVIYYSDVLPAYPDYYEPNDTIAAATDKGLESEFKGSVHNSADIDFFKFTAYTQNYIKFIFTANQSDLNFSLYSNNGGTLIMNQIIPAGTAKTIEWGYNGADMVCHVKLTGTSDFTPFNYTFEHLAFFSMYDTGEPNDTFNTATEISSLTVYDNTLHNPDDADFYKFYAQAGITYEIQAVYYIDYDMDFTLYDKDQSTVIYQENSYGAPEYATFACKSSGYYYLKFYVLNKNLVYTPSYALMFYAPETLN